MTRKPYRPRLSIDITDEQRHMLNKYCAYGEQRRLIHAVLDDIVVMLKEYGYDFVSVMLQREFTYRTMMEQYYANKGSEHPVHSGDDR